MCRVRQASCSGLYRRCFWATLAMCTRCVGDSMDEIVTRVLRKRAMKGNFEGLYTIGLICLLGF